jgi:hypothetical protein
MADTWDNSTSEYGDPNYWTNFGFTLPDLAKIGGYTNPTDYNFWNIAKNLLSGKSDLGQAGQLGGIAGIYGLLNSMGGGLGQSGQGIYKGYQGGIPNYTASRTMNTLPPTAGSSYQTSSDPYQQAALIAAQKGVNAQQLPEQIAANANKQYGSALTPQNVTDFIAANKIVPQRRPGSGGVTYFSPMQYTPVATAAPAVTSAPGVTVAPTVTTAPVVTQPPIKRAAGGGISTLGGYSDGGRLLRGPGDGVSDSIPATIGRNQPAKLADGEFVIPARIVSEIGNGSTEAGARKLYAMMDRVQKARKKSLKNVAANTKADKYLPT